MKEDVLEQVVDDYLKFKGYFTTHNVRFRPAPDHPDYRVADDSVPSDVDVVGYHPKKEGLDRVVVVSCKSWQGGFNATAKLAELRGEKAARRQHFREMRANKWSQSFRTAIAELTGVTEFTYLIAVTRLSGDADAWKHEPLIGENLPGCSVGFLTLKEMWADMLDQLTTTPAPSEIGRLAQLLKAAGLTAPLEVAEPEGPAAGSDAAVLEGAEDDQ